MLYGPIKGNAVVMSMLRQQAQAIDLFNALVNQASTETKNK